MSDNVPPTAAQNPHQSRRHRGNQQQVNHPAGGAGNETPGPGENKEADKNHPKHKQISKLFVRPAVTWAQEVIAR